MAPRKDDWSYSHRLEFNEPQSYLWIFMAELRHNKFNIVIKEGVVTAP